MSFKENLLLNLKGEIIEYQGKKLYVVEQYKYKKDTYLCTLDMEEIPETVVIFLKKKSNTIYEYINDEKMCDELFLKLGSMVVQDEIEKAKKEMNK